MNAPYLYKGNSLVCTFQTSPTPQTLVTTRSTVTAFHKDDKTPLLTESDKNIKANFVCKLPVHLGVSWLAFGAGLLVGAALILSGPIGWVTIAVAVAATAGAVVSIGMSARYIEKAINHTCTGHLKGGIWLLPHSTVDIDGSPAVTQMSLLSCSNGGFLKPFMSPVLAKKAASNMMWTNIKEIGFNAVASFFAGMLTVTGIGTGVTTAATATVAATTAEVTLGAAFFKLGFTGICTYGGIQFMTFATSWQKSWIRSNDDFEGKKNYDAMNTKEGNPRLLPLDLGLLGLKGEDDEPRFVLGDSGFMGGSIDDASDMSDPYSMVNDFSDANESRKAFYDAVKSEKGLVSTDSRTLQIELDRISKLTRADLKNDAIAQDIIKRLDEGKLPEIKKQMEPYKTKIRKGVSTTRLTPTMRDEISSINKKTLAQIDAQIGVSKQEQLAHKAETRTKAAYGALYFIPFLNTYLTEQARKDILEAAWKDMEQANQDAGTTVFAARPLV